MAPGLRAAVSSACAILEVASFVEDLYWEVCPGSDEAPGSETGSFVRIWFRLFRPHSGSIWIRWLWFPFVTPHLALKGGLYCFGGRIFVPL